MKYYVLYDFYAIIQYGKMTPSEFETLFASLKESYINLQFVSFELSQDDEYKAFMERFYSTRME